jgi:hypothetical protein
MARHPLGDKMRGVQVARLAVAGPQIVAIRPLFAGWPEMTSRDN